MGLAARRKILKALAGGAIVLGFNPSARRWVTDASASPNDPPPALDGILTTDPAVPASYADDYTYYPPHSPNQLPIP